jgi:hypothetical protein
VDSLKFPIGGFELPAEISEQHIEKAVTQLEQLPFTLRQLVSDWSDTQLDTPYREGGWTARQLIHHLADSHLHSLIRYKWALSEETPLIKAYDQDGWAHLPDAQMPIESSLLLVEAVHQKIVYLVRSLRFDEMKQAFIHPDAKKERTLLENTLLYAWHGAHHYAHLEELAKRNHW